MFRAGPLLSTSEQSVFAQTEIIGFGPYLSSYHSMLCERSALGAARVVWPLREAVEDANCQAGVWGGRRSGPIAVAAIGPYKSSRGKVGHARFHPSVHTGRYFDVLGQKNNQGKETKLCARFSLDC